MAIARRRIVGLPNAGQECQRGAVYPGFLKKSFRGPEYKRLGRADITAELSARHRPALQRAVMSFSQGRQVKIASDIRGKAGKHCVGQNRQRRAQMRVFGHRGGANHKGKRQCRGESGHHLLLQRGKEGKSRRGPGFAALPANSLCESCKLGHWHLLEGVKAAKAEAGFSTGPRMARRLASNSTTGSAGDWATPAASGCCAAESVLQSAAMTRNRQIGRQGNRFFLMRAPSCLM